MKVDQQDLPGGQQAPSFLQDRGVVTVNTLRLCDPLLPAGASHSMDTPRVRPRAASISGFAPLVSPDSILLIAPGVTSIRFASSAWENPARFLTSITRDPSMFMV